MNNKRIWSKALKALTDPKFIEERGKCQTFARQVVQSIYGTEYDKAHYHGDAIGSANAWRAIFPNLCRSRSSVPGDLLYWTKGHGKHGHVAIRIPGNKVAENSTAHNDPYHGGKGIRDLEDLDEPDLIVRLPAK